MSEVCHICGKPFSRHGSRFLHLLRHVQDGIAVATFNTKREWWFRKINKEAHEQTL